MSFNKINDSDEKNGGELNPPGESVPSLGCFTDEAESQNGCADEQPSKSVSNTKPNAEARLEATPTKNEGEPIPTADVPNQNNELIPVLVSEHSSDLRTMFNEACEEFLRSPEVQDLMNIIAEERVRINYLLSLNSLPEINFSLYTLFEHLQLQFEARLNEFKQKK